MLKKIFFLSAISLLSVASFAQYYWDFGLMLGGANYLGEIGGKEKIRRDFILDMKIPSTRLDMGAFVRYKFLPSLSGKLTLQRVSIHGADRLSTNPHRRGRNIEFKNNIIELGLIAEYYLYTVNDVGRTGRYRNDFRSYIWGGGALYYHNPKGLYNGQWYDLRPLMTEGQAKPYAKFGFAIPLGVGFYYTVDRKHKIGWEIGWRTTFSDYLDDASTTFPKTPPSDPIAAALSNPSNQAIINQIRQENDIPADKGPTLYTYRPGAKRGDPEHKDAYLVTSINYSYSIRSKSKFYRAKHSFIHGRKKKRRKARAKF